MHMPRTSGPPPHLRICKTVEPLMDCTGLHVAYISILTNVVAPAIPIQQMDEHGFSAFIVRTYIGLVLMTVAHNCLHAFHLSDL